MSKWIRGVGRVGLGCGVVGILVSGCADNQQTIFIRQVIAGESGQCTYSADPTAMALGLGHLDLMLGREYRAALLVGNQLVGRGASDLVRAETSRVQLEKVEVHVQMPDGSEISSFTVPGNGFLDPGAGAEPGWGAFLTILIDADTGAALSGMLGGGVDPGGRIATVARVVAVVKVLGHTLGGANVESGEFRYPIEVCYGCLVTFPLDATDPLYKVNGEPVYPNCQNRGSDTASLETPCVVGQDDAVDCRVCHAVLGSDGASKCEP